MSYPDVINDFAELSMWMQALPERLRRRVRGSMTSEEEFLLKDAVRTYMVPMRGTVEVWSTELMGVPYVVEPGP